MHWLGTPELTLSFLIGCTVKATLVLTLAASVARASRNGSAAMRHHAWALGIACSLALPILTLLLPSWHSATLGNAAKLWGTGHAAGESANFQKLPSTVIDAAAASPLAGQLVRLILFAWALGALFIAVKLFTGLLRLAWVSARSTAVSDEHWAQMLSSQCARLGITRSVKILLSPDPASMPLTWGFVRPCILLPAGAMEWPDERQRTVLSHELAHIARHDWLAQICGEVTRAIYWFHPLVSYGLPPQSCEAKANALATTPS